MKISVKKVQEKVEKCIQMFDFGPDSYILNEKVQFSEKVWTFLQFYTVKSPKFKTTVVRWG